MPDIADRERVGGESRLRCDVTAPARPSPDAAIKVLPAPIPVRGWGVSHAPGLRTRYSRGAGRLARIMPFLGTKQDVASLPLRASLRGTQDAGQLVGWRSVAGRASGD